VRELSDEHGGDNAEVRRRLPEVILVVFEAFDEGAEDARPKLDGCCVFQINSFQNVDRVIKEVGGVARDDRFQIVEEYGHKAVDTLETHRSFGFVGEG